LVREIVNFIDARQYAITIALLYILLLAGGLWHVTGVFETQMRLLATPMVVGLTVLLLLDNYKSLSRHDGPDTFKTPWFYLAGTGLVLFIGYLMELLGIWTGAIFGQYRYGTTLQPMLFGVPLFIGCAWYNMLNCSSAIQQKIFRQSSMHKPVLSAVVTGLLMVLFDYIMEPAAVRLNYWSWEQIQVPWQNYLAWFGIGFLLAYATQKAGIIARQRSNLAVHAYMAQLAYFLIVSLGLSG
jgi:putative membrane protein